MAASHDPAMKRGELIASFSLVRKHQPLVHHISNFVTLNDCANAAYAVGARPTMAFDPQESALAASQADAIVWNLGTFNSLAATAIHAALPIVAARPIPVVIDPVAAQAYPGRRQFTLDCLDHFARRAEKNQLACTIFIRGNETELTALTQCSKAATGKNQAQHLGGVDHCRKKNGPNLPAHFELVRFSENLPFYQRFLAIFPANMALFLVETGETDRVLFLSNGRLELLTHERSCLSLTRMTGAGCVSNTLIAAMAGAKQMDDVEASRGDLATSALAAVAGLVRAGQLADAKSAGIGSFRCLLFDELEQAGIAQE